jgi:hypothetical protein
VKIYSYYKNFLKIAVCAAMALLFYSRSDAQIFGAYWSFNDNTPTNWTTAAPTVNTLPSATLVRAGSALNNYNNTAVMGSATYTAFDGSTHVFNQDSGNRRCMAWDTGSTGNSFTLQLNTTGYEDFILRFDYRHGSTGTGPTSLGPLEYSLDNGLTWTTIFNSSSISLSATYSPWSYNLSSISAIENVSSVWLRLSFDSPTGNNFRIDNVEITGQEVPEPNQIALLSLAFIAIYAVSRKMLKNRQA